MASTGVIGVVLQYGKILNQLQELLVSLQTRIAGPRRRRRS